MTGVLLSLQPLIVLGVLFGVFILYKWGPRKAAKSNAPQFKDTNKTLGMCRCLYHLVITLLMFSLTIRLAFYRLLNHQTNTRFCLGYYSRKAISTMKQRRILCDKWVEII